MLASRELPAALVELLYLKPSEDETQLVSYDRHLIALWEHTWHWLTGDFKSDVLFASHSLREVAAKVAKDASPFEFAHMVVITSTEGFEEESPWEIFPIEQVLEEVGSLFEKTPKFLMEFGTREFNIIPVTTWAPCFYSNGTKESQTHLLYVPTALGNFADHLIFVNMKNKDESLDPNRWDTVEVGLLCGNEVVVIQTYKGTAQHYSDSRVPADVHREELISIDEARRFIELTASSIERDGETFVDVWGKAVLTPLGQQILAGQDN
jgi:hypothetical protein